MLVQIADGVHVHVSAFLQSNSVVVEGRDGVLLIDPGITRDELACIAADLHAARLPVAAGFSTHPHWDHVLWDAAFGDVPRYATARGAASMADVLSRPDWIEDIAEGLPPEHADDIPMELLGATTALPEGAEVVPWDGPTVRIIEHRGHSDGDAALLIEDARVLVAGDMLSDALMPFLDLQASEPVADYLSALELFDGLVDAVDVVVPGHGTVGSRVLPERIALDRAYVRCLRDGGAFADPRVGPGAPLYWLPDVHEFQVAQLRA